MKRKIGLSVFAVILALAFVFPLCVFAADSGAKLMLKRESINIGVGEADSVYGLITNKNKYKMGLKFSSSDSSILSVDGNGRFKGLKAGQADIVIYVQNELHAVDVQTGMDAVSVSSNILGVVTVNVKKAPTYIKLNAKSLALGVGEQYDLNVYAENSGAYRRTFSSSDESIVRVDASGMLTPVKTGKAKITAKIYNGKTAACTVTVTKKPVKIAIINKNVLIQKGADRHHTVYKVSGGPLKVSPVFSVSDSRIASVDKNGYVTGVKIGKAYVKLRTNYDNIYTYQKIAVVDNALPLNRNSAQLALDFTNVKRVEYGQSCQGRKLEAYIITNRRTGAYSKTLFMDFAVHGFEDSYARDGKVLVSEANRIINYYAAHSDLLGSYRLVIVPCANPDGVIAGKNNYREQSNAFGRCTAEHIDINRDFRSFRAVESQRLKKLLVKCEPDIYLNMHGWLNESMGSKKLNGIIVKAQGFDGRLDELYGWDSGYIIGYAHNVLGIPAALVEYKAPDRVSLNRDVNMINAIIEAYK